MNESTARRLYTLGWWLALPLVALYLLWRSLRQREYLRHWPERFLGRAAQVGPGAPRAPVIWLHAVSVGETRAAEPLVAALATEHPQASFVLTHMTPTGRAVGEGLARALPGRIAQRYLPYDVPFAIRRFFSEVTPAIGIVMETELWPNLLFGARAAGVPMVLVNARLSDRSLAKAQRAARLVRAAAACLARVGAQSIGDRDRIAQLYAGPVDVTGNMKFDIAPPSDLIERGRAMRTSFGERPVWLFASSREGEEALVLDAFRKTKMGSDPIFLIVPRHPQRFDEVARLIESRGFLCQRRSKGFKFAGDARPAVLLGDSMGEMALYYAAADAALIGGSLLPFGSQNLIEACAAGTPVVLGPSVFNFEQAARDAIGGGAAVQVSDAAEGVAALAAITLDPPRLDRMRSAALAFAAAHRGATARTVAMIEEVLAS